MSSKMTLKNTPFPVRVGGRLLQFVTLEDVYGECLKPLGPAYFDQLASAVAPVRAANPHDPNYESIKAQSKAQLAGVLDSRGQVLPEKCFCTLFAKLSIQVNVDAARTWLTGGLSWKKSKTVALKLDAEARRAAKLKKGKGDDKGTDDASGGCHWDDCPDAGGRVQVA